MKSEPSIEELLQAVIEFIANSVIPKLEGHDKFHAHVAKNTLGIVLREIMLLRDYDEKEVARLKNILSKDDNIKELNKLLSEKIRNGEININDDSLKNHLIRTTMAKLSIDQPHYSGYLKGKEDNYPNDSES